MEKQNSDAIHETKKWKTLPSMITPRLYFGATAIEDKIYLAGGRDEQYRRFSSAEVYDCKSNKWSPLPNMNKKRSGCGVTSVNGKVYFVGGHDNYGCLASCEMFDPATNEWSAIPSMKEARFCCAACAVDDKLYVIGGYGDVLRYGRTIDSNFWDF